MTRKAMISRSNNAANPNKNVCGLAVANALGVGNATRYLHTWSDMERAVRSMYSFRSVRSAVKVKPDTTLGSIRKRLKQHCATQMDCIGYVVHIEGHVVLLDPDGATAIDTAAVQRDRRKIKQIYGVYMPVGNRDKMRKLFSLMNKVKDKTDG